jgi:hypothetical protein
MRIYQFTAIQPPAVTARLIRASAGADTTVVLDLEDSLWDVDDEARTAELKAAGRAALKDLARSHANLFAGQPMVPPHQSKGALVIDENKRNVHYFEADSMAALFDLLQAWQNENEKRFLSFGIENDAGMFCCIALTNPSEVIIMSALGTGPGAYVSNGSLSVRQAY